jgi:8-oxo-dGTP diphosphatase
VTALDLVRAYFDAINRGDLDAVTAAYDDTCVVDGLLPDVSPPIVRRGRDAVRAALGTLFDRYEGAFPDGTRMHIRTLGRIETGWTHAEWVACERERQTGELRLFTGYSHFLFENGRIREQRTVSHPAEPSRVPGGGGEESARRYPERPVVGVGAVVLTEGRVVLIKRRFEPLAGQWSLPGGALELGETLEAGVAREILEETGLEVEVGPVIEVFDRILLDEDRKVRYHYVLVDYLCRPVGGRLQYGSDVADVVLANPDQLDEYRLTPKAAAIIRRAVEMDKTS